MLFLLVEVSLASGAKNYQKCIKCHGLKGENSALRKSDIIANYSKKQLILSIKAYQDGSRNRHGYGSLMHGQVNKLSLYEIESIAEYIGKKDKREEKKYTKKVNQNSKYSSFTGVIDALYNEEEEVEFTITHDSIQILRYDEDGFRGVNVYPNKKRVYIFRKDAQDGGFYVEVSTDEYLNEIINKRSKYRLSVNRHFTRLTEDFKLTRNKKNANIARKYGCDKFSDKLYSKGRGRAKFIVTSCLDLGIPKSWLVYTDLGIVDEIDSFPFFVSLSKKEMNLDSISRVVNGFKDALEIPFTYAVVAVSRKKITYRERSIWDYFKFEKLNSIEEFKEAFSDTKTPEPLPSSSYSSGSRGHSSFSDIFD